MDSTIIVSIITLVGVVIANILSFIATRKENSNNFNLFIYRVEQLEKKVDKHNNFAQRLPIVEEQLKVVNHRLSDLEGKQ
jgi:hypothetical protein